MTPAKVYYTDLHAQLGTSLLQKLERLIRAAGIDGIDFEGRFTALKLHFGEEGNLAYLRPNYVKVVADVVKELGGVPFLTDCNTLYVGSRKNAVDHLNVAMLHGFGPMTTGCQVIIADGLKGTDEAVVPVPAGEYVREAKIGRAIADADIIVTVNHFKGHESAGFGGALKNLGMGCGSPMLRRGFAGGAGFAPGSAPTGPSPLGRRARLPLTTGGALAAAGAWGPATLTPSSRRTATATSC